MKPVKLEELRESSVLLAKAPPLFVRGTIYVFLLLVAIVVTWSYYVHVPIVVRAEGRVRPAGRIRRVDAEAGGRVVAVHAKENQTIKEGDLLLELDPAPLTLELKRIDRELAYLGPELDELKQMASQLKDFDRTRKASARGLQRHRERFNAWVRELELGDVTIRKKFEEVERLEKLDKAVLVEADLARAKLDLAETKASRTLSLARHRASVEKDLEAARQKVETLSIDRDRKKDELARLDIRAPVAGTVTQVEVRHGGEVVETGQRLFLIAPKDAGFMAEVWVPGHEAGFVETEMEARVEVLTFPEASFGYLPGRVQTVAPDVASPGSESTGDSLYRVEVVLERDHLKARDGRVGHLRLGLLTRARLVVREERLLFHVVGALREAFRTGQ